jgi:hypothetical protein
MTRSFVASPIRRFFLTDRPAWQVHRAPHGTYEGALSVLSPELVLFLKRETPSLELCRVTRGTAETPPSLRVVRTLALPPFHTDYRVHTAYMQTDRHSARRRPAAQQHSSAVQRPPSPLPFHSAPDDMVVGITFLLRQIQGHRRAGRKW